MDYPQSHFLICGDAGSRKSTLAAQFPKPAFVFQMDSWAKAGPYRRAGVPGKKGQIVTAEGMEDSGGAIAWEEILNPSDKSVMFRIEHFQTVDISAGVNYIYAMENFIARLPMIAKEVAKGKYETVIFDSLSSMAYEARKFDEYKMNPTNEQGKKTHGMQHYGASARSIEELMRSHLSSMRCNVVVLGHLQYEKDAMGNVTSYWPMAPGNLPKQLPSVFPESYVMMPPEKEGDNGYLITSSQDGYTATTQIPAPNPCEPTFEGIWANWLKEMNND